MNVLVRPALASDADALAELDATAATILADHRGGRELLDELGALPCVGDSGWHVGVADVDGVVLGAARTRRDRRRAVLTSVFVDPAARRIGLGHLLLVDAMATARAWGCGDLDATALPGDRGTKNFFEAHGMRARLLVVSGAIGDRGR